MTEDKGYY